MDKVRKGWNAVEVEEDKMAVCVAKALRKKDETRVDADRVPVEVADKDEDMVQEQVVLDVDEKSVVR